MNLSLSLYFSCFHLSVIPEYQKGHIYMQINISNNFDTFKDINDCEQKSSTKNFRVVITEKINAYLANFTSIDLILMYKDCSDRKVKIHTLVNYVKKISEDALIFTKTDITNQTHITRIINLLQFFFYHGHELFFDVELYFSYAESIECFPTNLYTIYLDFLSNLVDSQEEICKLQKLMIDYICAINQFSQIHSNQNDILTFALLKQFKNLLKTFFQFFLDNALDFTEIYQQLTCVKGDESKIYTADNQFEGAKKHINDFQVLWRKNDEFTCIKCFSVGNFFKLQTLESIIEEMLRFNSLIFQIGFKTVFCFDINFHIIVFEIIEIYMSKLTPQQAQRFSIISLKNFIFQELLGGEEIIYSCLKKINNLNNFLVQCRKNQIKSDFWINDVGILFYNDKTDILNICETNYKSYSRKINTKLFDRETFYNLVYNFAENFKNTVKKVLNSIDKNLCMLIELKKNKNCDNIETTKKEIQMQLFYSNSKTGEPYTNTSASDLKILAKTIFNSLNFSIFGSDMSGDENDYKSFKKKLNNNKNFSFITCTLENRIALNDEELVELFKKESESEKKKVKSKAKLAKKKTKIKDNEKTNENNFNKIEESNVRKARNSIILEDEPLKTKSINKKVSDIAIINNAFYIENAKENNNNGSDVPLSLDSNSNAVKPIESTSFEKGKKCRKTPQSHKDLLSKDEVIEVTNGTSKKLKKPQKWRHIETVPRSQSDKPQKTCLQQQKEIIQNFNNINTENNEHIADNNKNINSTTSEERFEEYGKRKLTFYIRKLSSSTYMFDHYKDIDIESHLCKKSNNNLKKHTSDNLFNYTKDNYSCFDIQQTQCNAQDKLKTSTSNQKIKHNIDDEDNEKNGLSNVDNIDKKLNVEQTFTKVLQNTANKNMQRDRQTISTMQNDNLDYQNTYKSDVKPYIKRLVEIKTIDKFSLNEKSDKANRLNGSFNASKINDKRANTVNNINHYKNINQKQNTNHANISSYQDIKPNETLDNDERICKIGMTEEQLYKYQVFEFYRENMVYYIYIQINNNAPNIGLSLRITNTEIIPLVPVTIVSQDKINDNMGILNVSQLDINQNKLTNSLQHYTHPFGYSDILNNPDGYYIQEHDIFVGNRIHMKSVPCILKETYVQYHSTKQVVYKR